MVHKYQIIIYWSEKENIFIAEVPELVGCITDGNTQREALQNAQLVIEEWISVARELGRVVPKAKGKVVFF
jgi:predicted RNase H-like HicB family nuclease